jgi:hypothetical protein
VGAWQDRNRSAVARGVRPTRARHEWGTVVMGTGAAGATTPLVPARVRVVGQWERRPYRFLCGRLSPSSGRLHDHRPRHSPPPPPAVVVSPVCGTPNALPWPVEPDA